MEIFDPSLDYYYQSVTFEEWQGIRHIGILIRISVALGCLMLHQLWKTVAQFYLILTTPNAADAVADCITCALCAFSIQVSHNSTPLLLCTYIIVVVNVVSNVMAQFQLIC